MLVHNNNDPLAYVPPLFVISVDIIQLEITSILSRVSVYNHQSISTRPQKGVIMHDLANKVVKEILCFTVSNHKAYCIKLESIEMKISQIMECLKFSTISNYQYAEW